MDSTGVLTWTPTWSYVGTTNRCHVSVTDSGTPNLSAQAEFDVVVVGPPMITSLQVSNDVALLKWSAIPDGVYQVECLDHLRTDAWADVGEAVVSPGYAASAACSAAGSGQRFFRVRLAP